MKRSLRNWTAKLVLLAVLTTAPGLGTMLCLAAESDHNQLFSFKRIFIEPAQDNVDGTFRDTVDRAYRHVFGRNPRFELVSEAADSDATIKTRLDKKTTATDIDITMVLTPTGEVFSQEHGQVAANAEERDLSLELQALLKTTLRRIPFYGTVTGRDGNELTFDIGEAHGLRKGDIIQLSRIDNVKRHPLLKSIVDVRLIPVGTAAVDEIEDTMAFGHVNSEIAGERIQRWHKITAIEGKIAEPEKIRKLGPEDDEGLSDEDRPKLGFVGLGFFLGTFSSSSAASGVTYSGTVINPGANFASELWLTKNWFFDLGLAFSTMAYRQDNVLTGDRTRSVRSSTTGFDIHVGYRYLPHKTVYGPHAFVKFGYHSFSWDTGSVTEAFLSSKSYSGLDLGLGGVLPLGGERSPVGLLLNAHIMLFPTVEEDIPQLMRDPSASGVGAFFGGYYEFNPHVSMRAGVQLDVYQASDERGAKTDQTRIGFVPSLLYYF